MIVFYVRTKPYTLQIVRLISIPLLLFLSISAFYGGIMLMIDPTGNSIHLSIHELNSTAFKSYFIPGLILTIFNGVVSVVIAILVIVKYKYYPYLILLQGMILLAWMITEIILVTDLSPLQLFFAVLGFLFILFGGLSIQHQK
ncbi:MAG: hypothetical protein JWN78_1146 [Bacteroidota bacterium]|nr:hypothetical protein [Bacteroidota bacterium]